jgi:drug/metabolite transporter (DMT)-like permease
MKAPKIILGQEINRNGSNTNAQPGVAAAMSSPRRGRCEIRFLIAPGGPPKRLRMTWWGYALLSAACWGMQYILLEILFGKLEFAAAYSFLSIANGVLVALILFVIHPKQDWSQLLQSWSIFGLIALYLLFGSGAYLFNAYAIRDKNATLASLLEIAYPLFIILFTALFLRKIHLNLAGFLGALLIVGGSILVVASRSK